MKDTIMRNGEIIYLIPDEKAQFPGGTVELMKYIYEHLDFFPCSPEIPVCGKCYLELIIQADGKISNVSVIRGVPGCSECDKEAIRVIRKMPVWTPAVKDGVSVTSQFCIPIRFCF